MNNLQDTKNSQPEQEPVAWMIWGDNNVPSLTFTKPKDKYVFDSLYTTPPQRTWVGLSQEDFIYFCSYVRSDVLSEIEAKLKELNT